MIRARWRARDLGQDYVIDVPEGTVDAEVARSSARLMELLLPGGIVGSRQPVRSVLADVHRTLFGGVAQTTETVRRDLAAAARLGRVVVARSALRATFIPIDDPGEEVLGPASTKQEVEDWLELKVVDDDGKPVPGVRYVVTAADGSTREGRVDKQGFARLDGLQAGTCTVTFPDVDSSEIKAA